MNTIDKFHLFQNYPNPFNNSTMIEYQLSSAAFVSLTIHDMLGQKVATLATERKTAGTHSITWNAEGLTSGVYISRLKAKSKDQKAVLTRKLVVLK